MTRPALLVEGIEKTFVMHLRGGAELPVVADARFEVAAGECVGLGGPSGVGKSSLLRIIYGNYRLDRGHVWIRDGDEMVDLGAIGPRRIARLRGTTLAYVSQFLRVIPRIATLDLVSAALLRDCMDPNEAAYRARDLLRRLNLPERLWSVPPTTFSGGEQARVNIARGFAPERTILLLDEPTASLDAANRAAVVELIQEKKRRGTAIVGIFHDEEVRSLVADRIVDVSAFSTAQRAAAT